jgi:hypothetical protein
MPDSQALADSIPQQVARSGANGAATIMVS